MSPTPVGTGSTLVGRYVLGTLVGRGGVADVYRAEDLVLSRQVAVKVLRAAADLETDRARFVAEARTLANLGHHGLVTVLDAGISDTQAVQPFLVMELVEGQTLSARIAAGPCSVAEVEHVAVRLADALAFAHARDVVHRDVKPANVLLGITGAVKLADFGIARLIGDTVRHTQTGHAVGTAAYLAPEQVLGEPLTTAADLYSLGLVLLEMFTREPCYTGLPTEAALARLSRAPEVPADVPEAWRTLLTDLTAREPAARPTATQVVERLRDLTKVGSGPVLVSAPAGGPPTAVLTDLVSPVTPAPAGAPAAARQPADVLAQATAWARALPREHLVLAVAALLFVLMLVVAAAAGASTGGAGRPQPPAIAPTTR